MKKRLSTGSNNGAKELNPKARLPPEDRHREQPERGERMTKNKIREAPLPRHDNGDNYSRPGLPTPLVRKSVHFFEPEPTSNQNQQHRTLRYLSSLAQRQHGPSLASPSPSERKGPQVSRQLGTKQPSRSRAVTRFKYVYWCTSHQQPVRPEVRRKLRNQHHCKIVKLNLTLLRQVDFEHFLNTNPF